MKNIKLITSLFIISGLSACHTESWSVRDTSTLAVNKAGIYSKPKIAELKIDNVKVTGVANSSAGAETIQSLKDKALQDALGSAHADILVEPLYEVTKNGNQLLVKVKGFPARITGFRDIEQGDSTAITMNRTYAAHQARTNMIKGAPIQKQ